MLQKVPIQSKIKIQAYSKKFHNGGRFRRQPRPLLCEFYSPLLKKWESFNRADNKGKKGAER
jgi:hypothetical protein